MSRNKLAPWERIALRHHPLGTALCSEGAPVQLAVCAVRSQDGENGETTYELCPAFAVIEPAAPAFTPEMLQAMREALSQTSGDEVRPRRDWIQ